MKTLAERVLWILEHRRRPDGDRWTQRGLGEAAGLPSSAHVGMMARGTLKNVRVDTLAPVAKTAGVSLRWLATGEGSPDDDDDARGPSRTEDPTPILGNAEGWDDVVSVDCAEHPDITPAEVETATSVARYAIQRPAVSGDLWDVVKMIRSMNDPREIARRMQAQEQRLQKLIAGLPEQAKWEQEQLAKKAQRNKR